jgi:hypothetical protein
VATVAGLDANCGFIDEFHDGILSAKMKNPARGGVLLERPMAAIVRSA